ncbi:MAG: hypothetical protein MUO75_01595, partial [Actinobacteria bacterium]|nr:hypothetical protein [Actinomycetota bacterium]
RVIAQKGTAPDGKMLASRLENLETQKEGILSRMSATAGPDSILAPAAGARVQVLDPSGSLSLGDGSSNTSGQADGAGIFEFDYASCDKNKIPEIEATVELDGQKTIVPLFASGECEPITKGRLEVKVEPRKKDLTRGQTEQFILTLNSKGGEKLGGTRMVLEDRSGASLIDGQSGKVEPVADDNGRCAFTVTKTSNQVSRISLGVFDGTWVEMGDVMALGTTEKVAGGSTKGGVVARVTPSGGGNRVELDNGRVQVVADSNRPYAIIKSMNKSENKTINLGPLEDMLSVSGQPGVQGTPEISGPFLVYANNDSAVYEIDIKAKRGEITLHRIYQVSLAEGNEFVLVSCKASVESSSRLEQSKTFGTGSVPGIRMPRGLDTKVGGIPVESLPRVEQQASVAFDVTRPYVTFKSSGKGTVLCYPTRGPDSWSVDNNYIYTAFREDTLVSGITSETTSFLGFSDEAGVPSMINESLEARINFPTAPPGDIAQQEGFEIECTPSLKDLKPGRQRFTVTIRKRYEKLSDYFGINN